MSNNTIEVTDANFEKEVLQSSIPVVVDFWAAWCPPCRAMAPIVEELAGEYAEKIRFAKLDVDKNNMTAATYSVMSIPTFIIFKNGKALPGIIGAMPKDAFKSKIDALLQ